MIMLLVKLMDRKCLMEFSTVEDIEERTVTLAHCSMKSNTKWKGTELSLSMEYFSANQ